MQAMQTLGYDKEDLNTRKSKAYFLTPKIENAKTPNEKQIINAVENSNTVD